MTITGGIFGWGRTNVKFAINSSDNSTLLYDAAPDASNHALGVDIVGGIPFDFTLTPGQFRLIQDPDKIAVYMALLGFPLSTTL